MKHRLASFVSFISSPYFITPVFGLWVVAAESPDVAHSLKWAALLIALTILPPFLFIIVSVRRGLITDLHVMERTQRALPLIISTVGALALFVTYGLMKAPVQLTAMAAGLTVCGVLLSIITAHWKISIHSAVYTGSVITVGMLINLQLLWLLLLLPVIFWSRTLRNRHTLAQGIVASLVSGACVIGTIELALR